MNTIQLPSSQRLTIAALTCLVLGGAVFGLGYRQGHRAVLLTANHQALIRADQTIPHPAIPANATPEMKEFLQNQATLADKMEQLREQAPNGTLSPQVFAQFRQENATLLARQSQLSQVIAQQQNKNTPTAPPLQIPPKASPQLTAYLTLRDQLMRDEIAFMDQHKNDALAARQAAMQEWHKQNAPRFQQLQQLAQALPQTATVTR
jgi:hypothetical protein